MTRAVDGAAVVIGYLRPGRDPKGWASCESQRLSGNLNISRISQSQHVATRPDSARCRSRRQIRDRRIGAMA